MTSKTQSEKFSLHTWIRNVPWSRYFKDGCRLIVKSPLNFFIFFCCLSVVVWGAFLVLLMGNLVKLNDDHTQKLWIEIASQVLNGFFTLANVPVHPKRFLGLVRGFRIKQLDNALKNQFIGRFLGEYMESKAAPEVSKEEATKEFLEMLDFYRCFPEYGRIRGYEESKDQDFSQSTRHSSNIESMIPVHVITSLPSLHEKRGDSTGYLETNHEIEKIPEEQPVSVEKRETDLAYTTAGAESDIHVGVSEDALHGLVAEETNRVAQSIVMPFLPFTINTINTNPPLNEQTMPTQGMGDVTPSSPRFRHTMVRELSSSSISRATSKRTLPRTKARTMSMSLSKEGDASAFFVREAVSDHSGDTVNDSNSKAIKSSPKKKQEVQQLVPIPSSLTSEQMDWVDEHQSGILKIQETVQKGWPWYNFTIPEGIKPVDFFATPEEIAKCQVTYSEEKTKPAVFRSSPSDHIVTPSRFCLIVGLFNINSFVQEILCGFMWGMNYHVRPGWVVGTGMAVGCLAAIIPSVLIMLNEHALGQVRVVATTEEAIDNALNEETDNK